MLVEIPAFFIYCMPTSRNRKKKKNPLLQVVKESEFIYKDYNGQRMKVANPKHGKTKTIVHPPQPSKDEKNSSDWNPQGLGEE